jgi:hypothetical protein
LDFILIFDIFCYDGQVMVQAGDITIPPEPSWEGTSQPKSLIDVSDDDQDEALLKLNEDELRELQKANSIQCIEGMQILPKEALRFDIPLYWMVYIPLVRPTLVHDIKRLEAEFTHGYRPGASVFYVSITNEHGEERFMKDVVNRTLTGPQWTRILKPSWLQTLTYAFFMVICFTSVMGTIASRHGQATLTCCTEMTESGITQWIASA